MRGAPASNATGRAHPSRAGTMAWITYDLANTIFSFTIVSFFFPVWVVNVMGGGDTDYAVAASVSMAVIFVLSPLLGALSDQAPRRLPFLIVSTVICVGLTFTLGRTDLGTALALFVVANIAYQAGLQFYDSLLPEVSTPENRGRVSGIGIGMGYLGSLLAIAVGRFMLAGQETLSTAAQGERYARLFSVSAVMFLVFALPCFVLVRERVRRDRRFSPGSVAAALRQVAQTLRSVRTRPRLVRFLVARALYTDAINTVIAFMGIYVTNAVGFTAAGASQVMAVAIIFAVVGGLVWGRIVDRVGPRRTLRIVLLLWCATLAWAAIVGFLRLPRATFWPVACAAGIALGGTWTADRTFLLRLSPRSRVGEFYGLYGMVGRFSAITGPLLWSLVSERLGLGRPAAITSLLAFVVAAGLILSPVSDRQVEG